MPSLTLPYGCFFDSEHATMELRAQEFAARTESRGSIRDRVRALGHAGLLQNIGKGDVRSLAVTRGALSYQDALDDLAFVIQELGGFPLAKTETEGSVLEAARRGEAVLCFAMTEPDAGSDLAGMTTIAEPDGHHWRLSGVKHYISNAPEADHAVVFAKVGAGGDPKSAGRISAFFVENPTTEAQSVSGHSIGRVLLDGTPARRIAERGGAHALATLKRCRPTVGLAAWGLARRGFDETITRLKTRNQFGKPLSEQPVVQSRIADMALDLEQAALTALWACWTRDRTAADVRTGYMSAIGKLTATEACSRVLDQCVQLHGALGVDEGALIQQLWRDARPLRIYEGATDVLKTVIAERWLTTG
jgi:acyl-CoA dehydrogenase